MIQRLIILLALVLILAGLASNLLTPARVRVLRSWYAHLRGYDGCLCPDCAGAFGMNPVFLPPDPAPSCFPNPTPGLGPATAGSVLLGGALFGGAIRRRMDARLPRPGTCASCGYSLEGLATRVCPECGHTSPDLNAAPPPPGSV